MREIIDTSLKDERVSPNDDKSSKGIQPICLYITTDILKEVLID